MPELNQIGAVVVTYNSAEVIGNCLDAALGAGLKTVVVDNASMDTTCAEVFRRSEVKLIRNPWNRGFAAAANQGTDALRTPYVLLLNPDAVICGGVQALAEACSRPGVAAAGGKLTGEDGCTQAGFMVRRWPTATALAFEMLGINRLWPSNPVNRRYRCLDFNSDVPAEVEQPAGAFLMFRREVWQELGGFDESFRPLWFEDVDFTRRTAARGYTIRYEPKAIARHKGAHSVGRLNWGRRQLCWYDSLLNYAARHFSPASFRATCLVAILACTLRAVMGILAGSVRPLKVYIEVIRLACLRLALGSGGGRSRPATACQ